MSKFDDKLQDWIAEAKKDGLDPLLAKWTFKLSRARGVLAGVDRELTANEAEHSSLVFRLRVASVDKAAEEEFAAIASALVLGRKEFAEASELVAAAETVLELLQRRPAVALVSVPAEKKARFEK